MNLKIVVTAGALLALPASSSALAQALNPATGSGSDSASSWVAGVHAGYNWQRDTLVYGVEADLSATHLKSSFNIVLTPVPFPATASSVIDWYGTVRGRIGWTSGPVLLYATGGLAYGNVDLSSALSAGALSLNSQTSSTRFGFVVGGGIDYLWRPNTIVGLRYQYVDLGTVHLASSATGGGGAASSQNAEARARFQVLAVGVSWLFPPDGPRRGPWEGGYVGGQAGGAWGNRLNGTYSATVGAVSDIRLKRDIALIGHLENGLGLYRYRYTWSDEVHVGVMAQEVALIRPDAIIRSELDDYLRVDYSRLGSH
jgi:outer membrane immunogenic protein